MIPTDPPRNEEELIERAWAIAGRSIAELAGEQGLGVPQTLKRAKGFIGQLVERALGANAKSLAEPDFMEIGVELKTIPVDARGQPKESTFVCSIPIREVGEVAWSRSRVQKKLARVLWLPVEADPDIPIAARRVGAPLLWSPSDAQEAQLRADWEALGNLIADGYADSITAHLGDCLQVRPKAAHSGVRTAYRDEDGAVDLTLPRGFYLRARFTAGILSDTFDSSSRS